MMDAVPTLYNSTTSAGAAAYGTTSSSASGLMNLSFLGSFASLFTILFFFIGLAIVLYYFTGQNKKGDAIVSNFMKVGVRVYSHVWMFIGALTVFLGMYQSLNYLATKLLPKQSSLLMDYSRTISAQPKEFVTGLLFMIFGGLIWASGYGTIKRFLSAKEQKGTLVHKFYVVVSLILYSTIWFFATVGTLMSIINYAYGDTTTISASSVALMIASLVMLVKYKYKVWRGLVAERAD